MRQAGGGGKEERGEGTRRGETDGSVMGGRDTLNIYL